MSRRYFSLVMDSVSVGFIFHEFGLYHEILEIIIINPLKISYYTVYVAYYTSLMVSHHGHTRYIIKKLRHWPFSKHMLLCNGQLLPKVVGHLAYTCIIGGGKGGWGGRAPRPPLFQVFIQD